LNRTLFCALSLAAAPAAAQAPTELVGVFEPVNYNQDIELTDVFFVTPEIGYVGGAGGTILKTTDSGATWTALLGGDPLSEEREIRQLWFIDETTGWATQVTSSQANLFRTTDGDLWEAIGVIDEHYDDFAFTSETDGIYVDDALIYRTQDAGKTWSEVYRCAASAQIGGLARQLTCNFWKMRYASPSVIYALGAAIEVNAAVIVKSVDGGASWAVVSVVENQNGTEGGLFFVDENTGYFSSKDSQSSFRTTDGGQTWSPNIRVTTMGTPKTFTRPGDYLALVVDASNVVYLAWTDGRRGTDQDIYFARYPSPPGLVEVTVDTDPPGLQVQVDGDFYATPARFGWTSGSTHSVSTFTQMAGPVHRYSWLNWSDGGTTTHTISAPSADSTLTATFYGEWYVSLGSNPSGRTLEVDGLPVQAPMSTWWVEGTKTWAARIS